METLLTACCPDPRYCIACVYCIVLYLTEGGGLHVFFVCVVLTACRPGLLLLFSRLLQSHLFIANCPRASANVHFLIVKFLQFGVVFGLVTFLDVHYSVCLLLTNRERWYATDNRSGFSVHAVWNLVARVTHANACRHASYISILYLLLPESPHRGETNDGYSRKHDGGFYCT